LYFLQSLFGGLQFTAFSTRDTCSNGRQGFHVVQSVKQLIVH
jgi:hypothetical protein